MEASWYFNPRSWETGDGARDRVLKRMKQSNAPSVLIATDTKCGTYKRFASVPSYDALVALVLAQHDKGAPVCFYEIIDPHAACRVYYDVDCKADEQPADFPTWDADRDGFLRQVLAELSAFMRAAFDQDVATTDYLVSQSHKKGKLSFHISLPWRLPDQAARLEFKYHLMEHKRRASGLFKRKGIPDDVRWASTTLACCAALSYLCAPRSPY